MRAVGSGGQDADTTERRPTRRPRHPPEFLFIPRVFFSGAHLVIDVVLGPLLVALADEPPPELHHGVP